MSDQNITKLNTDDTAREQSNEVLNTVQNERNVYVPILMEFPFASRKNHPPSEPISQGIPFRWVIFQRNNEQDIVPEEEYDQTGYVHIL